MSRKHATPHDKPLAFNELPEGDWILVAMGEVKPNPIDPFDPLIEAWFERTTSGSNRLHFVPRDVPASWCVWSPLGSLWRGKYRIAEIAEDRYKTRSLLVRIGEDTVSEFHGNEFDFDGYQKAIGATEEPTEMLVPPRALRVWNSLRPSLRFVAVKVGTDPAGLIIPTYALAQFYLCTSPDMGRRAFNGDLVQNEGEMLDRSRTHWLAEPGHFQIAALKGVDVTDCPSMARFAAGADRGPERGAYRRPFQSLQVANHNRKLGRTTASTISAQFPFVGWTELKVWGTSFIVDLPNGVRKQRIMALQIQRCSGAFPYTDLRILLDATARAEKDADLPCIPIERAPQPAEIQMTHEVPFDRDKQAYEVKLPALAGRFTFLDKLKPEVITVVQDNPGQATASLVDSGSAKPGDVVQGNSGQLGAEVTDAHRVHASHDEDEANAAAIPDHQRTPCMSASAQTFDLLIDELQVEPLVAQAESLVVGDWGVGFTEFRPYGLVPPLPRDPPNATWHLYNAKRSRLLFCAEVIVRSGQTAYIMDIEPREKETKSTAMVLIHLPDGERIKPAYLADVARVARKFNRLWSSDTVVEKIQDAVDALVGPLPVFTSFAHNLTTASNYRERVIATLVDVWQMERGPVHPETGIPTPPTGNSAPGEPKDQGSAAS